MNKRMQNVAGVRNAEMRVSNSQSRQAQNNQYAYQRWLMSRPDEYWNEIVEKREWNKLRFSNSCRLTSAQISSVVRRPHEDAQYESMVYTMLDMLCSIEGISIEWEFPIVATASASVLAQMKRKGGSMSAWAHKQNPATLGRKVFREYQTLFVQQ